MMTSIIFILTSKCNLRCSYCLLDNNDPDMGLESFEKIFLDILNKVEFDSVGLMGGEIGLLDDDYLEKVVSILDKYQKKVYFITNLNFVRPIFLNPKYNLQITAHDLDSKTLSNLFLLSRPFTFSLVANDFILSKSPHKIINLYKSLTYAQGFTLGYMIPDVSKEEYDPEVGFKYDDRFLNYFYELKKEIPNLRCSCMEGLHILPSGEISWVDQHGGRFGSLRSKDIESALDLRNEYLLGYCKTCLNNKVCSLYETHIS